MMEKPECRICDEEEKFDPKLAAELLYALFNPFHVERGNVNPGEFIKKYLSDELREQYEMFTHLFNDLMKSFGYINPAWASKLEEYREARKKAWQEIREKLISGEIGRSEISASDLVDYFYEEVIEELTKEGYIDGVVSKTHRKSIVFNAQAERIMGEKVLRLALQRLGKKDYGEHESEKKGISIFADSELESYDEYMHTFDMLDIQETLVNAAIRARDGEISIDEKDMVVRQTKHAERCVYVMLIDVSDSMRGRKIIGAIEAALALKRAIKSKSHDELHVIAFNHRVRRIAEGEILNLNARGRTDIGLALKRAREILRERRGSGVVFLITDGEPTASYSPYMTPWACAMKEAENLRQVDARLTIVMFGKEHRFLSLCNRMARAVKKSNVLFFPNPLDLKTFLVRSYLR
ncbi:VWA domain-containing protein [Archaeoglobus veneficus]|uniref:von Willebrand factor type A n=1 Tax=Archaeoglobus veneficus (strain DSM 11195 / SNP6) TaxID=693661 RepID=F2KTD2_ARCVS|nr:VWA domain-containing protein [Archaeoglobus veneficus]AEA47162.1 von Willebrand factor type A [Archaeoglobus veneficus SNP6]